VANEKIFLVERIEMLRMQTEDMLNSLNGALTVNIPAREAKQDEQNARLAAIAEGIKQLYHLLANDVEPRIAAEGAVAVRQDSFVDPLWDELDDVLVTVNRRQTAELAAAETLLYDTAAKLNQKLAASVTAATAAVSEVHANTYSAAAWTDTRHCTTVVVPVDIDPYTAQGSSEAGFPALGFGDLFNGAVPVAQCAIRGFTSHLNLYATMSVDGYGYPEPYQNLAVAVDCKAFNDRVLVEAFDQSRGGGNSVDSVYVTVKLCSFAATP
jgi:hypothetical protein